MTFTDDVDPASRSPIKCDHHWHSAGLQLACHPPTDVMRCCRCGVKGYQGYKMVFLKGCGPHAVAEMVKDGEPRAARQ